MQQFTVPQFIDVEDKIIGPLTTRQFLIMLFGFAIIGLCYKMFDFSLFITASILIFAISGIFAFFRINGRPFHFFVLNLLQTLKRAPLRVWDNNIGRIDAIYEQEEKIDKLITPYIEKRSASTSRLAQLSLIVDTRGVFKGEEENKKIN
jgi:hypothetical protein